MIGIVGGIGSGKSAVAQWVARHARVEVLDADKLGHEALDVPSVQESLVQRFGSAIRNPQGGIIRSELARLVFGIEPSHLSARRDLEQIIHPEISQKITDGITQAAARGQEAVLLDAAILLEAGWRNKCDFVVFIDTPDAVRLERVQTYRGWSPEELKRRESSQWSLIEKRRESDLIVPNDGDLEQAGRRLLESLQQRGLVTT